MAGSAKRLLVWGCMLALAAGAVSYYLFYIDLYHFEVVQPGVLYRGGLQGMRRFKNAYAKSPFRSVINVQSNDDVAGKYKEQFAEEQSFCAARGIKFFHIPMKERTPPAPEQKTEFLQIAGNLENQPVFLHDSQGVVREGMMVAVWQKEKMGYTLERCLAEVRTFGHADSADVTEYIKRLYAEPTSKN